MLWWNAEKLERKTKCDYGLELNWKWTKKNIPNEHRAAPKSSTNQEVKCTQDQDKQN